MTAPTIKQGHYCWLSSEPDAKVTNLVRVRLVNEGMARVIDVDGVWDEVPVERLALASMAEMSATLRAMDSLLDWDTVELLKVGHHGSDPGRALDDSCWLLIQGETWPDTPLGMWHRVSHVDAFGTVVMANTRRLKRSGTSVWAIAIAKSHEEVNAAYTAGAAATPLDALRGRYK